MRTSLKCLLRARSRKLKKNKSKPSWHQFQKLIQTVILIVERNIFRLMMKVSRMSSTISPKLLRESWRKLISRRSRKRIWTRYLETREKLKWIQTIWFFTFLQHPTKFSVCYSKSPSSKRQKSIQGFIKLLKKKKLGYKVIRKRYKCFKKKNGRKVFIKT